MNGFIRLTCYAAKLDLRTLRNAPGWTCETICMLLSKTFELSSATFRILKVINRLEIEEQNKNKHLEALSFTESVLLLTVSIIYLSFCLSFLNQVE